MDRVIANVHPFVIMQTINVYKNNRQINSVICDLKDLTKTCYNLCKQYDIHRLELVGQQLYSLHIKDELAANQYNDFDIDIKIC